MCLDLRTVWGSVVSLHSYLSFWGLSIFRNLLVNADYAWSLLEWVFNLFHEPFSTHLDASHAQRCYWRRHSLVSTLILKLQTSWGYSIFYWSTVAMPESQKMIIKPKSLYRFEQIRLAVEWDLNWCEILMGILEHIVTEILISWLVRCWDSMSCVSLWHYIANRDHCPVFMSTLMAVVL